MNYGSIVPSFYFYKFADAISKPYTSFEAYRAGVIDERGNFIKPESSTDPFEYFVQAGAFRTQQDADAQRAKLAMLGWEARVSERETNGRVVFRVRIGPFSKRDDAESLKDKLDGAGVESALVRVQR